MKQFSFGCLVLVLWLIGGCATTGIGPDTSEAFKHIQIAQKADVSSCRFLGDIHGVSILDGPSAAYGFVEARKLALAEAAKIGATHVVWEQFLASFGSTSVHGNAYRCSR